MRSELLKRLADELKGKSKELTAKRKESILTKIDSILDEVETLQGIVPICCVCKRVRIDTDYWTQVEAFVRNRSKLEFSHTYCPVCAAKALEELDKKE